VDQKHFQKILKIGRPIYYVRNLRQTVRLVNLHFSASLVQINTDKWVMPDELSLTVIY